MNLNPFIIELLRKRGITTEEDICEFLSDKPQKTYDPFLLADMEAGVDLILSETKKNARICIYGDYDADGITSASLMLSILAHLTRKGNLSYYIPSRFEEGYGLNKEAIENIADAGCDLLITVDCGSVSYDEVEYAKSLGLKVLVTDHHNIADVMADCLLINPKRPDCTYPFRELSGCGVAFKVAQAIQKKAGLPKHILTEVLDLAAIGTVGDVMPLIDENRTIVKYGLKVINMGTRPGLKQLMEGASLKVGNITSENISFVIVPHLNASGRIKDASQAVELLTGNCSQSRLNEIVDDIIQKNITRRHLQSELFDICSSLIDPEEPEDIIILEADSCYEGIAGIVAGKIKERYYRPAIILTPTGAEGELYKGTGRSVEGINLYNLLKTQENLFEKFGGHGGACGFSLKKENLEALRAGLVYETEKLAAENKEVFRRVYPVDMEADAGDMNIELAEQIDMLAPFGNKNPKPLIRIVNAEIKDVKYMGSEMQHVRFSAAGRKAERLQCTLFNRGGEYDFDHMDKVDIIGKLDCRIWQGVKRLQFLAEEIEIDEKVGQ